MRFEIYEGGDPRNDGRNSDLPGRNLSPVVRYAAHLKRRNHVVERHIDLFRDEWVYFLSEFTNGGFANGDVLATNLLAAGSRINELVVQIKRPVAGVTATLSVEGANDSPTPITGAVDFGTEGWVRVKTDALMTGAGMVVLTLTVPPAANGDPVLVNDLCFSVFADVTDFASEHECDCDTAPCAPAEYPSGRICA